MSAAWAHRHFGQRLHGVMAMLLIAATPHHASAAAAPHSAQAVTSHLVRALTVNGISLTVTNCGSFASDGLFAPAVISGFGGLVFPRGSGKIVGFAGGPWISGRVAGSLRTAVTEYDTEFQPGPATPGGPPLDTLTHRVFSITRGDTTGSGAWMARAVPLGAPVDTSGIAPGLIGDQTLWTIYTDAGVTSQIYGRGPRTPIGLEIQLTAYAFNRPPVLEDVAFLHFRIIHRGLVPLDTTYVGIWYDADVRSAQIPAASDTSLDMEYVYRLTDDSQYGVAGPATGVMLLRGPVSGTGPPMRATSIVGYVNGVDPATAAAYDGTLHGLYPWGAVMVDSTTMLPTQFYAPGDPVTGTGWNMPDRIDPKLALGIGPFRIAPGDTQIVDAVVVVGQGTDRPSSITAMRDNAREARAFWAAGFSGLPPPPPPPVVPTQPLLARPVPSNGAVAFDVVVPAGGARVELVIYDAGGRRIRTVANESMSGGVRVLHWDGTSDAGRSVRTGLYFARSSVAGRVSKSRVVLIR